MKLDNIVFLVFLLSFISIINDEWTNHCTKLLRVCISVSEIEHELKITFNKYWRRKRVLIERITWKVFVERFFTYVLRLIAVLQFNKTVKPKYEIFPGLFYFSFSLKITIPIVKLLKQKPLRSRPLNALEFCKRFERDNILNDQ